MQKARAKAHARVLYEVALNRRTRWKITKLIGIAWYSRRIKCTLTTDQNICDSYSTVFHSLLWPSCSIESFKQIKTPVQKAWANAHARVLYEAALNRRKKVKNYQTHSARLPRDYRDVICQLHATVEFGRGHGISGSVETWGEVVLWREVSGGGSGETSELKRR